MKIRFHYSKRVKGVKLGAWILQLAQGTSFSHLAIELADDLFHDEPMIFESVFPKGQRLPKRAWIMNPYLPILTYEFEIKDPVKRGEIRNLLYSLYPKKYSIFQLGLIAITIVFGFMEPIFGRVRWNGRKFLHCTELGAYVQEALGYKFDENLDTIDLVESFKACEALKEKGL